MRQKEPPDKHHGLLDVYPRLSNTIAPPLRATFGPRRAVFGIGSPLTTGTTHREHGHSSRSASWRAYLRILEDRLAKIETAAHVPSCREASRKNLTLRHSWPHVRILLWPMSHDMHLPEVIQLLLDCVVHVRWVQGEIQCTQPVLVLVRHVG
jgi:hypothetical protein